ncbi:MAG TPA: N-methyl-L-tryptophan oxidase [Ktedonobacterales bacterium]
MVEGRTVIVVGGGVMGLAAGCALAGRGARVTVIERWRVAHERGSSHGLTRAIRHEYGPLGIYTDMVARSLPLWADLARETGRRLYTETGILTLGQEDDGHTLPGLVTMRAAGLPVERLTEAECARRFDQFQPEEFGAITWNPVGGMMHASECLMALAERLRTRGGALREETRVARVEGSGDGVVVTLAGGERLEADRAIVTAGPWVAEVLPEPRIPVRVTHQQVMYLGGLPTERFAAGAFPTFLAGMEYYGFPLQGSGWLKVASHRFGVTHDPNTAQVVDPEEVERVRAWLRRVIPEVADAPLVGTDLCMYDLVADEDFVLDVDPENTGVVIGSGFSGHGFKFGILIGELLAALALDEKPAVPLERFRLARFGETNPERASGHVAGGHA